MFYAMLKERVATNYQQVGGFVGLLGLLSAFVVLVAPPWAVMQIVEVPPFTAMRLIIPAIWVAYLIPGSRMLPERLRPIDALRLVVWPLRKT